MALAKLNSILVNGYELNPWLQQIGPEAEAEALDSTVFSDTYRTYVLGFKSGRLSAEGLFSADNVNTDDIHDVLKAAFVAGTDNVITASLGAITVGDPAILLTGPQVKYGVKAPLGQLITVMAEFQA